MSKGQITYHTNNNDSQQNLCTFEKSKKLLPYISTYFQINNLLWNSNVCGAVSFSYNHNSYHSTYKTSFLDAAISNGFKENAYLPTAWISYMIPICHKNSLTLSAQMVSEIYKTEYSGTDASHQKLINNNYAFVARYNHTFSDMWSANIRLDFPIASYKVNDNPTSTKTYLSGQLTLNGRIGLSHSIYLQAKVKQNPITPNYYNSVVRTDNEIEGTKGNANLKMERSTYLLFSYTWMPSNRFSLNSSLSWDQVVNDIVPFWHPIDNLMVKEMTNSGNFNPINLTVTPSLTMLSGKLRVASQFSYAHEWHNGIYHINNNYLNIYPYANFAANNHLSLGASYSISVGDRGYMRGSSQLSRFCDNLSLQGQYTSGNFFATVAINSPFRRHGWVTTTLDNDYIHEYSYTSRPWDGRYVTLSLSYTLDFGSKAPHGDNLRFEGTSKSSAL